MEPGGEAGDVARFGDTAERVHAFGDFQRLWVADNGLTEGRVR